MKTIKKILYSCCYLNLSCKIIWNYNPIIDADESNCYFQFLNSFKGGLCHLNLSFASFTYLFLHGNLGFIALRQQCFQETWYFVSLISSQKPERYQDPCLEITIEVVISYTSKLVGHKDSLENRQDLLFEDILKESLFLLWSLIFFLTFTENIFQHVPNPFGFWTCWKMFLFQSYLRWKWN